MDKIGEVLLYFMAGAVVGLLLVAVFRFLS
jgi:hypothetical protein